MLFGSRQIIIEFSEKLHNSRMLNVRILRTPFAFNNIIKRGFAMSSMKANRPSAGIIIIGDEILKGQTQDTNTHFLATNLKARGIELKRVAVIPDDIDIIAKEVKTFSDKYEFVFTSGGVGPTHDDITFEGVAKAFDDTTFLHPEMEQLIRDYFKDVNDAVLKLGQVCYQMIILFFLIYCGLKQE